MTPQIVFGELKNSHSNTLNLTPEVHLRTSVHVSVCVQNTSFCQSAGRGIKSHLMTSLVFTWKIFTLNICPGHNFQTIKDIKCKLHTLIEFIIEMFSAQEP